MVGTLYDADGVTILEENHFNSWNSQLWRRVRNTFSVDLENMYRTLRSNGLFTLENMFTYFDAVTDIISPKMYNDSQQIKYIAYGQDGTDALHGNRKLQIRKWLRERIAYLDSKYGYYAGGGVGENYCNFRMNYQGAVSLDLTTYYTVYAKIRWATNNEQTIRIARGQKKTFSYYSDVGTDREVMIFLPESLKTIENISKIYPNSIDVSKATKLTQIEAHNANLFSVDLSKNKYLRKIDFNGCKRLGTETATMTLNFCKYLNEVDLRGTQITAVNFNNKGGSLRTIYYPTTVQSINLINQLLLKNMVLPHGDNGENIPIGLATITIENCPQIERVVDLNDNPMSLQGMKYCRNMTLNNSIMLEKFNFYGFTRLANVNLQNMETLKEIDFFNMAEIGQETSLRYIGVSACPNLKKISMNCDDSNYEIRWANNGLLDLQTAGAVEEISSNCIIKGLKTIVLPRSIKGLYFTDEYGEGYSDIKNIWAAESCTVIKTGVYPEAEHMNSENIVDSYEGIDFRGLHLSNIDLGALVQIPDAINFSLYPTHVNPNFNLNRDGVTLPYLQPKGILDLSNYTASLAKFFNGVDLEKLILICNESLPQKDLSYCFYNAIFNNESSITPITQNLGKVTNLDYCFYKTVVGIDILDQFTLNANATLNYAFGECKNITSLDGLTITSSVASAEGMFYGCSIKDIINTKINTSGSCKAIFKNCKYLVNVENLEMPNTNNLSEAFQGCVKLTFLPFTNISDRVKSITRMYYEGPSVDNIDGMIFGSGITESTDWIDISQITSANDVVIKNNAMSFENYSNLVTCNNLLLTSNVKTMSNYFKNCGALNTLSFNASSDISNVEDMSNMLEGCSNLTINPIQNIPDSVANIDYIYKGTNITDISGLTIGSGVVSATEWCPSNLKIANNVTIKNNIITFTGNTTLQYIKNFSRPNSNNWKGYFKGCTALKEDVCFPSNTINVVDCFKDCINLTHIHSNWENQYNNGVSRTDCYAGCIKISHIDDNLILAYEGDNGLDYIPKDWGGFGFDVINTSIYKITATAGVEYILNNRIDIYGTFTVSWGDGNTVVDSRSHIYDTSGEYYIKFLGCIPNANHMNNYLKQSITEVLRISKYQTSSGATSELPKYMLVTNFSYCLQNMPKLNRVNCENIDVSAAENLTGFFANNTLLTSLDLSTWKVDNVTTLNNFLNGCSSLSYLNLNGWNTSKLQNMNNTFNNCKVLEEINMASFNLSALTVITNCFAGCEKLIDLSFGYDLNIAFDDSQLYLRNLLSVDSLISILNGLKDRTGANTLTAKIGSTNLAKLTAEQIQIATDKNWSVI